MVGYNYESEEGVRLIAVTFPLVTGLPSRRVPVASSQAPTYSVRCSLGARTPCFSPTVSGVSAGPLCVCKSTQIPSYSVRHAKSHNTHVVAACAS